MLLDKLSENLPDALSNDYDIWDKLSNYCAPSDKNGWEKHRSRTIFFLQPCIYA